MKPRLQEATIELRLSRLIDDTAYAESMANVLGSNRNKEARDLLKYMEFHRIEILQIIDELEAPEEICKKIVNKQIGWVESLKNWVIEQGIYIAQTERQEYKKVLSK